MHANNDEVTCGASAGCESPCRGPSGPSRFGYLAIIGMIPFAGFFSKDKIIESALDTGGWSGDLLGAVALGGACITAFYMTRLMLMTFFGNKRWPKDVHPHESPQDHARPDVRARARLAGLRLPARLPRRPVALPDPEPRPQAPPATEPLTQLQFSLLALAVVFVGVGIAYWRVGTRAGAGRAADPRHAAHQARPRARCTATRSTSRSSCGPASTSPARWSSSTIAGSTAWSTGSPPGSAGPAHGSAGPDRIRAVLRAVDARRRVRDRGHPRSRAGGVRPPCIPGSRG